MRAFEKSLVVLVCSFGLVSAWAQQVESAERKAASETAEIEPIPSARIIERALATAELLRRVEESRKTGGELQQIRDDFTARKQRLEGLRQETLEMLSTEGPASTLAETEREWSLIQDRLGGWVGTLESRASSLGELLQQVRAEKAMWTLTRDARAAEELPPELERTIEETLESIEQSERRLHAEQNEILDLQATIGQAKGAADEILDRQRQAMSELGRTFFAVDSQNLWTALRTAGTRGGIARQISSAWDSGVESARDYAAERRALLLWYVFALVLLSAALFLLRNRVRIWARQDRSLGPMVDLLDRPFAAGVIIVIVVWELSDPSAPQAWNAVLGVLVLLAVLRLLPSVLKMAHRGWAYALAGLFLLQQVAKLTTHGSALNRLALLTLSLAGLAGSLWLLRNARRAWTDISAGWLRAIRFVMRAAALLFGVGAIANLVGSLGFAMILVTGTLRALFAAVVLLIAVILIKALVQSVMLIRPVRNLGIVAQRGETTRRTLFRWIQAGAVVAWLVVMLKGFLVFDPVVDRLRSVLGARVPLGELELTPGDLLVFAIATWASFKIARLLSFVLEADVLSKMSLPRGVPGAVTRLSRYVVIVLGLMIAVSAAGFPLDKVTIIFGALGVGIGFGLQNVVNNFVSGLILLFERPIQVGDMVQVGTYEGTVQDIGIRASTIRTWSGAEVVVPNAALTSSEVVNWTLRDRERRVEIPVGVAYGSAPQNVIEVLTGVAAGHAEVSARPEPQVLFQGFGDSSLDFELRAWTHADQFLRVRSELCVAIAKALAEAGIEIPFPQRDLHVRSVDQGALRALRNESEPGGQDGSRAGRIGDP